MLYHIGFDWQNQKLRKALLWLIYLPTKGLKKLYSFQNAFIFAFLLCTLSHAKFLHLIILLTITL